MPSPASSVSTRCSPILTAGGTGICGAAAVMGLAGSIKVSEDKQDEKDNDVTMAVAIVAIMGTVFALLEIALGPLTGMTKDQLGITAGASLHEIAHASPPATLSARWTSPPS